jgi:tripeptide aminopeptidase
MQVLVEDKLEHPPLEVVFTVREELGLQGAKELDYSRLAAKMGVAVDHSGPAGGIVVSAPYQDGLRVTVRGRAAHAGSEPEKGISAIRVAAEAIAAMPLGRIDFETTANIGLIQGGVARNAVPERTEVTGEARSRDGAKLEAQTAAMVKAFQDAAARHGAQADIVVTRNYSGFRAGPGDPMLQRLQAAARGAGLKPRLEESGGGSDVNIFRAHGIDALAISIGYEAVHTTSEWQSIPEMVRTAEMLLKLVTM